jgi:drug/metabolite transporter (DMT)-like permease
MTNSILLVAGTIGLNVAAQLLLKVGAARSNVSAALPLSLVNAHVLAGALCLIVALGFYVMVLQRLPLVLAQSLLSLQFVAVVLAATLVLGERVGPPQWAGMAAIAAGLFLLSR